MQKRSKVASLIGFARKARKISIGMNAVSVQKNVFLLLIDETASENSKKQIEKIKNRFQVPMVLCMGERLEDSTGKADCKMAAVFDEQLAKAILQAAKEDENYQTYPGGSI